MSVVFFFFFLLVLDHLFALLVVCSFLTVTNIFLLVH